MKTTITVRKSNVEKPFITFEQQLIPKIGETLDHPGIKENLKVVAISTDVKSKNSVTVTVN